MYVVYVLQDLEGVLYKGLTSNLDRRLAEHRQGKTKTTRRMKSFTVVYTKTFDNVYSARSFEKYLKTSAGRRYLRKIMGP